jgi:hypothetical protein
LINDQGLNLLTTYAGYRHHHKLADRWYLGHSISGEVNWSKPPYYLLRGLGYSEIVRGYEFYIVDGTRWGLFQSNLKFEILEPREIELPLIPSEKFSKTFVALYGNLFFDAGYVHGRRFRDSNSLVNEPMYSIGAGIDLVTYYDKVARFEGSINALGDFGFYVHFTQSF